jgi:hypothetical protein
MPIDLSTLSPSARASYITIGKEFGSTDTLNQANQTLQGLADHGPELILHGFAQADATRLQDARDALESATVGRTGALGDKKVTSATYLAAMKNGKAMRATGRAVLQAARRVLHELGDAASEAGVKVIDAALAQTRSAGDSAATLAVQLDTLRGVFSDAAVAAAAADRGGPQAVTNLEAKATALRTAASARAGAGGTPAATEEMDLLDGLIVTLARDARRAAREAAKRLGKPALAANFELTHLYTARSAAASNAKATPAQPAGNGAPAGNGSPPANPA